MAVSRTLTATSTPRWRSSPAASGSAFSEDADFDELDDLVVAPAETASAARSGLRPSARDGSARWRCLIALLVIAIGTRDLFFGTLPLWASWLLCPRGPRPGTTSSRAGSRRAVGTTAPASPAFGLFGLVGTVFFGAMGDAPARPPLRLHPLGRARCGAVHPAARLAAGTRRGRHRVPWACRWPTGRWARADGTGSWLTRIFPSSPCGWPGPAGWSRSQVEPGTRWRSRPAGQVAILGVLIAVGASFAPALVPRCCWLRWPGCSARSWSARAPAVGGSSWRRSKPWGSRWCCRRRGWSGPCWRGRARWPSSGCRSRQRRAPDWGEVIRFAVGPDRPLAARVAAGGGRGLAAVPRPGDQTPVGGPAVGHCVCVVGTCLRRVARRYGIASPLPKRWCSLPATLAGRGVHRPRDLLLRERSHRARVRLAPGGERRGGGVRRGRPAPRARGRRRRALGDAAQGIEQPLSFLANPGPTDAARVLWLGDPRALPVGGWSVEPGLAYGLTSEDLPDTSQVLTPAGPGPAVLVADAVRLATSGGTVHLGQLLASAGVRYIVLVEGSAPSTVGSAHPLGEHAAARARDRPPRPGRLARGPWRVRRAGLPERRASCPSPRGALLRSRREVVVVSECGRRGGLATVLASLSGSGPARGHRADGHRLRRIRPVRQLRAERQRATPSASGAGVRLGGAVRHDEGAGDAVAVAVPVRAAARPRRSRRVGRSPGRSLRRRRPRSRSGHRSAP